MGFGLAGVRVFRGFVFFGGAITGAVQGPVIGRRPFVTCSFFGVFGLSLLEFRDCFIGGSDAIVVAIGEAQGVIPVATLAVGVVLGILNRGEIAVGDVGRRRTRYRNGGG